MKISLIHRVGAAVSGVIVFTRKLTGKQFKENLPTRHRRQLYITKSGRLLTIRVPWRVDGSKKQTALLDFTESEIFLLAHLARRGRSDHELIEAIAKAAES